MIARDFRHITPRKFNMPFFFWLLARIAFGLRKLRINILGSEFAGEIEATGKDVKRFNEGDQVFGYRGQSMGAYAKYLCMPKDGLLAIKPANMTYAEAAAVPSGGMTALYLLREVSIQSGQKVLINGASGGIGAIAIQLARDSGAEVTGVCSTPRLELVKSLGTDKVIDYGVKARSSKTDGYLLASFKIRQLLEMLWTNIIGGKKVICVLSPQRTEDLISLKELIEAGKIQSVIDKCYPLEQTAEAHRYVEKGHKRGHVVITVKHT